ncbi:unnamed protein product, partial [Prunus brigantina]
MSDKASCSNVRALVLEEDNPTNDADAAENRQDETDLSKLDMPAPLLALCQYVKTKLKPANETIRVHMPEEVFGTKHDTSLLCEDILQFASMVEIGSTVIALYMRYLFDYLKMANMVNLVGLMDPGQVSSQSGTLSHRSKHLSNRLKKQMGSILLGLVPFHTWGHWVLIIVRPAKETVYYMDSLKNRSVDRDMRNIVNTYIWEWTTNASRNVEEDEQSRFSFVSEEIGMYDNDLGDIGCDLYEFANVIGDGDQPLYPGSRDLLSEGNTLPSSMYEAKKTLSALGMSYEKILACPNDCILYRKDYEDSTNCPTCGISRWKEGKNSILKEGVPAKFIMLTLLISFPKQPENDIDVYLEPLIDDLKSLWDGIRGVYDAHIGEYFTLRGVLLWTVNDFAAYGNLSDCVVKGYKNCPICGDDTPSHRLKNGHKICYIGHRKWLPINHPYQRQRAAFNEKLEYGTPPEPLNGEEVL